MVKRVADRIAVMYLGRLVEIGPGEDVRLAGPKGVFASVTRRRAREALTDAQQRLRPNPESCQRTVVA